MPEYQIDAAFIPLTDCAPLLVAHEIGFAANEGLRLRLAKETSWATIRDRLSVAHIDVAHALAPMPLASNLGLDPIPKQLIAPMALGFGGNTVTISKRLWNQIQEVGEPRGFDASINLGLLCNVVQSRHQHGLERLRFGVVHPHSAHRYELAYWLAAGGIIPGRDVDFVVLPPSLMSTALAAERIDGFCAGEPWGSLAVAEETGKILTTKAHIWRSSPEKVLALRASWVEEDEARSAALVRAVYKACCWCDDPSNRSELADLLSRPEYLDRPKSSILPGLDRQLVSGDGSALSIDAFLNFSSRAATFPWISHALWLYTQMVRWGEIEATSEGEAIARSTFRPDLYRRALAPLNVPMPSASAKVEGALQRETPVGVTTGTLALGPDGFFDGYAFDPDDVRAYIRDSMNRDRRAQSVTHRKS